MIARQRIAESVGATGCYFLGLLYLAEKISGKRIDVIEAYADCVSHGFMGEDCYIKNPGHILARYTGYMYEVSHADKAAKVGKEEFEILRFERKEPGKIWVHFVVGDGNGKVEHDPYGDSLTVRSGVLAGKRLIRKV